MKSFENIEKEWLENFLNFLNADIKSLYESEFIDLLLKYTRFLCHRESVYDFLNFRKKYDSYTEGLLERTDFEKLSERKEFFYKLQLHLRSMVEKITEVKKSENQDGIESLVMMKGTRKLAMDPNGDSLIEGFWPVNLAVSDALDLDNDKKLANLAFLDLIQQLKLNPKHICVCARSRCNNLFYQYSKKEKKFCLNKCSTADRQERYQKDKKKKPKKSRKT
jgi:hypothetical protein